MFAAPSASPEPGIAGRLSGFVRHLRLNGYPLAPRDTERALDVIAGLGAELPSVRLALRTALCSRREEWDRFDALFEAYWVGGGRRRQRFEHMRRGRSEQPSRPALWDRVLPSPGRPEAHSAVEGPVADATGSATGRLSAVRSERLAHSDLRSIADPAEMAEAEALALRLARSLRFAISRRRRADRTGDMLDLRRIIRRSLPHGGEPIELVRRRRPHRPARVVLLLDVSGSMQLYARPMLQFLKGLVAGWVEAEAFLFHTRLVRISDALREQDAERAMTRLSLMAAGFGGGTRIGASLKAFNDRHAAASLNSRSIVIIVSDGYDSGEPALLAGELARLRKRARRLVWLNPLVGSPDFRPARGMAAAIPHLDALAPAATLADLARLETEFARL